MEIVAGNDYFFTVKEVTAKISKFINYELAQRCTEGHEKCVILVENKRKEKGRYYDVLYVRTDSKHRHELPIQVVGMIR
ncbi:MAG: hypothetical protein ACOC1H_03180 [Desulfosalsimonas sp.]